MIHSVVVSHQICGYQISKGCPIPWLVLLTLLIHMGIGSIVRSYWLVNRLMLRKVSNKTWRFHHASLVLLFAVTFVAVVRVPVLGRG